MQTSAKIRADLPTAAVPLDAVISIRMEEARQFRAGKRNSNSGLTQPEVLLHFLHVQTRQAMPFLQQSSSYSGFFKEFSNFQTILLFITELKIRFIETLIVLNPLIIVEI